jgi:FkbM family methyltransferase
MAVDDPHGWLGFWDLYADGRWEPDTLAFMRAWLEPGDLFVDVGAWIGPCSIWAHSLGATVLAIEPDRVALDELCRRIPWESIYPGAIATRNGVRGLARNPKPGGAYGDSMSRLGLDGHPVPCSTLPGLLQHRKPPALVKIDVEGYETTLMRSLGPWLAERRIPLQVSCHGQLVSASALRGYTNVEWPDNPWGEIRAWV